MASPLVESGPDVQGRRYPRGFWPTDSTSDDGLFPDVVSMERGEETLTMTDHPIDSNGARTDHVYIAPVRLSVSFAIGAQTGRTFADVWNQLSKWHASATLMTVQTGKRLYTDMLIVGIANTTTEETENILWFDVAFQQLRVVTLVTGALPLKARQSTPKKTASKEVQGNKQTVAEAPKITKSGAANLFDNLVSGDAYKRPRRRRRCALMARWYKVPVAYAQTVEVVLDGVALDVSVRANDADNSCELDIGLAGAPPVIAGVRMTDNFDLLRFGRARAALGIPGALITVDASQNPAAPTPDTLGSSVFLYYVTDSEG